MPKDLILLILLMMQVRPDTDQLNQDNVKLGVKEEKNNGISAHQASLQYIDLEAAACSSALPV